MFESFSSIKLHFYATDTIGHFGSRKCTYGSFRIKFPDSVLLRTLNMLA